MHEAFIDIGTAALTCVFMVVESQEADYHLGYGGIRLRVSLIYRTWHYAAHKHESASPHVFSASYPLIR